jgi:hypothetical protein
MQRRAAVVLALAATVAIASQPVEIVVESFAFAP